jgi:hypothetical protein
MAEDPFTNRKIMVRIPFLRYRSAGGAKNHVHPAGKGSLTIDRFGRRSDKIRLQGPTGQGKKELNLKISLMIPWTLIF